MSADHVNGVADPPNSGNGVGPYADVSASPNAAERRPEIAVGAAFAGGFLLALLLRRVRS